MHPSIFYDVYPLRVDGGSWSESQLILVSNLLIELCVTMKCSGIWKEVTENASESVFNMNDSLKSQQTTSSSLLCAK